MRLASPWTPRLSETKGLPYERLVTALADDIASGSVPSGARLPAYRDLAYQLGIGLGTVTKAYGVLERRGLVHSVRGRGMFVTGLPSRPASIIDLSLNTPPQVLSDRLLAATLTKLAKRLDAGSFGAYAPAAGSHAHRSQMTRWLALQRLEATPDRVLLCHGAQHALSIAFGLTCPRDAVILTESVTYPGAIALARQNGHRLIGLEMDEQGLQPEALERALQSRARASGRVLYITPTLQNPTASTMGLHRREEIVRLCKVHDVIIVEDDVYSIFAPSDLPPLAALAPERTLYVSGLSKTLSPGLRIGVLAVPAPLAESAVSRLQATSSMASPISCAMMEEWLTDGTAASVAASIRVDTAKRCDLARTLLPLSRVPISAAGFHLWLPMLVTDAERLARSATDRGVIVPSPTAFLVDPDNPRAGVRLSLGGPPLGDLKQALTIIRQLLN
ncbi:aminotransferase-like domain-containing protein [Pseudochelatococcus sp. B33]